MTDLRPKEEDGRSYIVHVYRPGRKSGPLAMVGMAENLEDGVRLPFRSYDELWEILGVAEDDKSIENRRWMR